MERDKKEKVERWMAAEEEKRELERWWRSETQDPMTKEEEEIWEKTLAWDSDDHDDEARVEVDGSPGSLCIVYHARGVFSI